MRRVLRPGGTLLVATVGRTSRRTRASDINNRLAAEVMPGAPPSYREVPFSMHDPALLESLAREAGFSRFAVETVAQAIEAPSATFVCIRVHAGNAALESAQRARGGRRDVRATLGRGVGAALGHEPMSCPTSAHFLIAVA